MKFGKVGLAIALVLVLAASAFAADTVKIGVFLPLTGQMGFGGQLELDGVKMAHKEAPKILGKTVELIVVDNKSDKVEAANAVKRLIEREKVVAIIGTYGSSLAMAGGEISEKAGIPQLGTSCTNPLVTQGKKYIFRTCFIDPFQGAGAATYAFQKMKAKNAQLTEIISKKPDVLFIPSYFAEGAIIMKQVGELGGKFKIMGGDAMDNPEIVKIGGKAVEGFAYTTFPYDPTMKDMSPIAKKFTENWKAFPGKDPNVNAALGYDSYMLILDAIKRAGKADPKLIRDQLEATKNFPGVTGSTTMNATHDAEKPVGIMMIQNGERKFVDVIQPKL